MTEKMNCSSINKGGFFSSFMVLLICILLLSVSSYSLFFQISSILMRNTTEHRSFVLTVTVKYRNEGSQRKIWNLTETERATGLFMNNSWQTVYVLNASYQISEIRKDYDGNPVAYLSFPTSTIPRGENLTYQIAYKIILKPHLLPSINENYSGTLDDVPGNLRSLYCRDAGPWQVASEELRELAFKIKGNETNVLSLLKRFIRWIKSNINYEAQEAPQYPLETLSVKVGDCDDQANLLIAFCRIVGIPAYLQIGCIYLPGRDFKATHWDGHWVLRLTNVGWHGWAVVYVPPWGWLPVDLTFASGVLSDPANAIRRASIVVYPVVQYANITESDYIVYTRSYREFLLSNGFQIYEHDIMFEEVKEPSERRIFKLPLSTRFVRSYISIFKWIFSGEEISHNVRLSRLGERL